MKDQRHDDEDAEKYYLDQETRQGDMRARLCCGRVAASHQSTTYTQSEQVSRWVPAHTWKGLFERTTKLDEERHHIARYEDLCQPSLFDQTVRFAIHTDNDTAQYHVDTGCEQCRSDKDEKGLNNVRRERRIRRLSI